jgi:hypothetical protein
MLLTASPIEDALFFIPLAIPLTISLPHVNASVDKFLRVDVALFIPVVIASLTVPIVPFTPSFILLNMSLPVLYNLLGSPPSHDTVSVNFCETPSLILEQVVVTASFALLKPFEMLSLIPPIKPPIPDFISDHFSETPLLILSHVLAAPVLMLSHVLI